MWFNGKINSDGTIHFDRNEWECTDPDTFQFCRKVSDTEFEYIQLKDEEKVRDSLCIGRQILDYLNDETMPADWYQDEIDVADYSEKEIHYALSPYGGILDGVNDVVGRNQLIAECIFEQNSCVDFY